MIHGIGTDIVSITRIKEGLARHGDRFAQRILAESEFAIFSQHSLPAHYLAKRFAAKEAGVKAMGCGFRDGISLHHLVVESDELGRPSLILQEQAAKKAEELAIGEVFLSLSDEQEYAIAYVTMLQAK